MKKFIKKHLSVILSFAIILGTILPVLSGIIGVSALTAEEQVVVDQIKSGWSSLLNIDRNVGLYPNRWVGPSGGSFVSTGMIDAANYSETLPEGVSLGNRYATLTGLGAEGGLDTKQAVLFEFKDGSSATAGGTDRTSYNITEVEDVFFWVKLDNLTTDATLKIKINDIGTQAGSKTLSDFVISAAKSGQWVKVSLKELGGSGWYGNLTNKLYRVQVALTNVNGATATIGSAFVGKKVTVPSDSDTADWTLAQWIKAATQVDLSLYENTEALTAALNAAKASFGEQYAIGELMREWEALSSFHNPDINPNRWWKPTPNGAEATGMAESSSYTGTLPENVDLGANFATFTGLGDASGIGSKQQCILYEFCKDGSSSAYVSPGAKSTVNIDKLDDIYFWVKADNLTKDIILNIQVMTNDSGAKTNNLAPYVIPVSKSGQWVKVSLKELGGSNWYGNLTEKLYRVMVAMENAQGATVTVGSGKIVVPGACPVPSNVEDTAAAWLNAVKALDTSACVDTTAFNNAVNALKAYSVEDPAVEILKQEWAKLEFVGIPDTDGFKVGIWQNGGTTLKESNTNADQLVYDTNVDTTYGENQFTATGVASSTLSDTKGSAYFRIDGYDAKSTTLFADMIDITFWYKASGNAIARIGFVGGNATVKCDPFKNIDNVSLIGDGTWKQYSVKELIGETAWESVVTSGAALYLQRLQINLATFDEGVQSIDVSFGALNYLKKDDSLNGSGSWSNEQWVDKAKALDLSNYKNTAAFEAALYAAIESVYGFTQADLAAQELIAAWGEMTGETESVLYPNYTFPNNSKTHMGDNIKATTGTLPYNATKEMLGDYYVTDHDYNVTHTVANIHSTQRILFYGNIDDANNARKNVTNYGGFYFNIYFEELSSDITLMTNVVAGAENAALAKPFVITADKQGTWVTITDTDLINGGFAALGGMNELNGMQVSLSAANGATVSAVVGSLQFKENISAPEGAADMEPTELLMAAMALDLSKYGNTEAFVEKLEALKLLCEEAVAIEGLKKATNGLSQNSGDYIYPRRYWDADGVLTPQADTYAIDVANYTGTLPEGADATNYKSYLGNKLGVISSLTDMAAAYKTSGNKQTVLYEFPSAGLSTFTAGKITDMYFWYKLEGTASAKIINGIFVTDANDNRTPTKLNGEITLTGDGQWHKVSFNEVYGKNWVASHNLYDGKVYRLLMSIGEAAGGTITLGSIVTEVSVGLLPEGNESWTLSDWIYAVSKIDYEKYKGAEAFKEALKHAIEVRNRLQIGHSANVSTYDDGASADADAATLSGTNILETLIPVIEHSADGQTKNEVASDAPELFTDGDNTTVGTVTGLDNTDEASFTDFIYQFAGEGRVSDFFIYNDGANIADKYYIYVADTRSKLFTQDNLLVPYVNEEGKLVQRFNFDGKPAVAGVYLGIRVFGDTNTVSFAEFKAYGEVITYDVEMGNFSNDKIASIGENLLVGKTPKIRAGLKFSWNDFFGSKSSYKPEALTDADNKTPVAVYGQYIIKEKDDTISLHFYYDLGTTYTIDKLFINHWGQKGIETGKYEIYASRDVNSLFMSRNMLLSYDNTAEGPNETSVSQLFTLKNEVIARYVSFHITYPISDWDYCESEAGIKAYNKLYGTRLSEFGVYGTEWKEDYAIVNLASHVPADVYRTDADGNRAKVSETDYNGIEHKNTYDGDITTLADLKIKSGEKIDFVYNLAAEMTLEEICMKLGVGSVKRMNIYASTVADAIWDSSSLIYSDYDGLGETYFGKGYASSPIKVRYLRFEILENEGEDLIISEICAMGGNWDQVFTYMNLVEENPDAATFHLQDKATGNFAGTSTNGNKWLGSWSNWASKYPINKAFDNDNDSVYDLFGGKNGEESVNILLDLGTLNAIDDITLVAGSSEEYWPDELNFYFGDDAVALFNKDAKPAKSWTQSAQDAYYTYEFVPQVAQYVRIEFLRGEHEAYTRYFDHIGAVIGEIQVNGLELKSRAVNGVCATVEDEETGIKAEILALRENDVYDTIQDIMVVKRAATEEEIASAKQAGLKVATDVYEIYFLDVNGDIVTDTGGREIVIYLPENLYSTTEDIFVLYSEYGSLTMIEFDNENGYYYFTVSDISDALGYALGYMVEEEFESSEDDFEDTSDEVFEEEEDEEEDDDSDKGKRKKIKVVRRPNNNDFDYLWIIIVAAAVVVVAAGVTLFIILAKRKKTKEEENE